MAWLIVAAMAQAAAGRPALPPSQVSSMPTQVCPATPAPLPADYAGWGMRRPVAAGAGPDAGGTLALGVGATATLRATSGLRFAAAMRHAGTPAQFGGTLAFVVARPGRIRVSLGEAAWIDVVADGATAPSIDHGRGPTCSGIRKVVDFDLKPGRYLLQIAGNDTATLALMVAPAAAPPAAMPPAMPMEPTPR